jgi:glyoxylase-like metal-dependent hydrolase (beta-lactamase superfamily II)
VKGDFMKCIPFWGIAWESNSYLLVHDGHAALIDAGVSAKAVLDTLEAENASLELILLTHGHFDHTVSVDTLRDTFKVDLYIHENDAIMLTDGKKNGFYEFYGKECVHGAPQRLMSDGDELSLGEETVKVIHTPGHTKGSVCFLCGDFLVTGDTLFADSVGRTDLFGGSSSELEASLDRLRTLDGGLRIYPGHGNDALLSAALQNSLFYF